MHYEPARILLFEVTGLSISTFYLFTGIDSPVKTD